MCGIFGMISSVQAITAYDDKMIKPMTLLTSLRGEHGTGYMSINGDEKGDIVANWIKAPGNCYNLWESEDYPEWEAQWFNGAQAFFGHGRHATVGQHTTDNTHPFTVGNITLLHNGTIRSGVTVPAGSTDSEACAKLINDIGIQKTLERINGAYVFVWFDDRDQCLRIVKNDERPLHAMRAGGIDYFASEAITLEFIRERELDLADRKSASKVISLETDVLYTWNCSANVIEYSEEKLILPKRITPVHHYDSWMFNHYKDTPKNSYLLNPAPPTVSNDTTDDDLLSFVNDDVALYIASVVKKDGMWVYECFLDEFYTKDGNLIPAIFRTSNKDKYFNWFADGTTIEGQVIGVEKYEGRKTLVLKAKTIEPIEIEETKVDEDVVTANGIVIPLDQWQDIAKNGCYSCAILIGNDAANAAECSTGNSATGKAVAFCADCTNTREVYEEMDIKLPGAFA